MNTSIFFWIEKEGANLIKNRRNLSPIRARIIINGNKLVSYKSTNDRNSNFSARLCYQPSGPGRIRFERGMNFQLGQVSNVLSAFENFGGGPRRN